MPVQEFKRWSCRFPTSLAARRFRMDMATVNTYFWVGSLADGGLAYELKKLSPSADPITALSTPVKFNSKLGHDVQTLRARRQDFAAAHRQLTLIMISSALERYMAAISALAVESDPLLAKRSPRRIDGAMLKKHGLQPAPRDLGGLTRGQWSQRIRTYKSLFGTPPSGLLQAESTLESMRRDRNKVAHDLGVHEVLDASDRQPSLIRDLAIGAHRPQLAQRVRLSERRLIKIMGEVQECVDGIDDHLMTEHIGAYELVSAYLEWTRNPEQFERLIGAVNVAKRYRNRKLRFGKAMGDLFGVGLGSDYITGLESYVAGL